MIVIVDPCSTVIFGSATVAEEKKDRRIPSTNSDFCLVCCYNFFASMKVCVEAVHVNFDTPPVK